METFWKVQIPLDKELMNKKIIEEFRKRKNQETI